MPMKSGQLIYKYDCKNAITYINNEIKGDRNDSRIIR